MITKTRIIILTTFLILGFLTTIQAQDKGDIVLVRLLELPLGYNGGSELTISYGDNKTETIALQIMKRDYPKENLNKINAVITKLYSEGYEIVSSSTSNSQWTGANLIATLWVFKKKE